MRQEISRRRTSLRRISDLYDFGRLMALTTEPEPIPRYLAAHLYTSLNRPSWVRVGQQVATAPREPVSGQPVPDPPPDLLQRAASHAGGALTEAGWTLLPLEAGNQTVGLAAVRGSLDDEAVNSARGLCEQASVALDRTRLIHDLEEARLVYETEQLRSALLSSVSHDLRTPLASVIGSATSLLEYGDVIDPEDRRDLLETIHGESRRLDRHIQNLLDMTRIGQGGLSLRRDWVDLRDVVSGAVGRLRDGLDDIEVQTSLAPDLPLLWVHGALLEQALLNLLDNALRFSPPGAAVALEARMAEAERMEIDVCDQGPGIAEGDRERVFDMFYTARHGDRGGQGTGLGLTICRAMIGAHGGEVEALPGREGRGTRMRISLPLQRPEGGAES
jgi:two-component system sensor histidine kinase KdpD